MKGYTLIEILVGLTIIGLVFSFGFVSFREFSRRQAVIGVAKQIKGDLRLAQGQALAGKKPESCTNVLDGYDFHIIDDNVYKIEVDCKDLNPAVEIKSVTLSPDISINIPSPNPISFKPLGQGTNIEEGQSVILTLTQTGTNNQATITITAGGEIK